MSRAMIMAAGVGSRLEPLTNHLPKPLVPIAGRPVMDILLEKLSKINCKDVIANVYYQGDKIIKRYSENSFGINFNYLKEEHLSGTAGGVKKCQHFFEPGEDFFVLSADGLTNADLLKGMQIHKNSGAIATIGIKSMPIEAVEHFGVVVADERGYVAEFQEKPRVSEAKSNLINTGIYIFNYDIFNYIPDGEFCDFAKNVFPKLLEKGQLNTFEVVEYWSDIGTIEQYRESSFDMFNQYPEKTVKTPIGSYIAGEHTFVAPSAKFFGKTIMGKNCVIGKNTTVDSCILWDNVAVADNSILKNCIIGNNCEIRAHLVNQTLGCNQILHEGVFTD